MMNGRLPFEIKIFIDFYSGKPQEREILIVAIEGHIFDTSKAKKHYELRYWDDHNWIEGDLYESSHGTWYVYTPSQWRAASYWRITTAQEAVEEYRNYLSQKEIEEIIEEENVETE
jgi:hypothetical protein